MTVYVALFRGINVGGHNLLPMKSLAALLANLGLEDVRTYIQSGNAVFRSSVKKPDEMAARIAKAVQKGQGFEPRVLILSATELDAAIAANPFPDATAHHKSLHFYFLADTPKRPNVEALEALKQNESFVLADRVFYLHSPEGLGKSKLAERVEKHLGVAATARNWQTVSKLQAMARL